MRLLTLDCNHFTWWDIFLPVHWTLWFDSRNDRCAPAHSLVWTLDNAGWIKLLTILKEIWSKTWLMKTALTLFKAIMIMPVIQCEQCRPAPMRGWVKLREFGAVWIKLRGMWGEIRLLILTLRRLEAIMLFVIQCEQWWTAPRRDWGESKDRSVVVSSIRPIFTSHCFDILLLEQVFHVIDNNQLLLLRIGTDGQILERFPIAAARFFFNL